MTKKTHYVNGVFVLLLAIFLAGCNSSARQTSISESSSIPASIASKEWDFKLVAALPSTQRDRRIRCNADQLCWVWDANSVWVGNETMPWRVLYSQPSREDPDLDIAGAYLQSPQVGWIVKRHFLLKTEDGGHSFHTVSVPGFEDANHGLIQAAYFADANHGWIVGGRFDSLRQTDPFINTEVTRGQIRIACIFETADGGSSWNGENLPRLVGSFDEVLFWDHSVGIASSPNHAMFTADAGKTWVNLQKDFPSFDDGGTRQSDTFENGYFLDGNRGWLVFAGFEFEALTTINGGKSYEKTIWAIDSESEDTSSHPPRSRFAFVDDQHGLFVYSHWGGGELFETVDGGKTWKQIHSSSNELFFDIFFDGRVGVLLTNKAVYRFSKSAALVPRCISLAVIPVITAAAARFLECR